MNPQDWIEFKADFSTRFPSTWEWLDKHPKTLSLWYRETFSGLALADCLSVSEKLYGGEAAGWEAFQRERIPSIYRHQVGLMRQERRNAAEVNGYREHDRKARGGTLFDALKRADQKGDGKAMLPCFVQCERMRREGQPMEERQRYVAEYFGEASQ